jgi:hypothetical protein
MQCRAFHAGCVSHGESSAHGLAHDVLEIFVEEEYKPNYAGGQPMIVYAAVTPLVFPTHNRLEMLAEVFASLRA